MTDHGGLLNGADLVSPGAMQKEPVPVSEIGKDAGRDMSDDRGLKIGGFPVAKHQRLMEIIGRKEGKK